MSYTEPHDEFLELCAVSTSGQLTEEEQKRLNEHLLVCSECREALRQYDAVVKDAIPSIAANETQDEIEPGPGWSPERAEANLFDRLAREESSSEPDGGIRHTGISDHRSTTFPFTNQNTWRHVWSLYVTGILLLVALGVGVYQLGARHGAAVPSTASSVTNTPNQPSLEAQLSDAAHEREIARVEILNRDQTIADLRKELARQAAELNKAKTAQQQLEGDLRSGNANSQALVQQQAELKQKFDVAQANTQTLQAKLELLTKQSSQDQARTDQLQSRVTELAQLLNDREAALDQKDELLAKDRDIRELMGARDLYITEVYDVDRTGETRKPYGRVFYTKGKSLIFYAYDLDQEKELKTASFQAWGRRGPDRQQALSLGIFYEDNASKKRWVLKLEDSKTLAVIDAVFVTVEPQGGSQKPSGKPLLFAYLKTEPNHP